jgi:hypothetical protein
MHAGPMHVHPTSHACMHALLACMHAYVSGAYMQARMRAWCVRVCAACEVCACVCCMQCAQQACMHQTRSLTLGLIAQDHPCQLCRTRPWPPWRRQLPENTCTLAYHHQRYRSPGRRRRRTAPRHCQDLFWAGRATTWWTSRWEGGVVEALYETRCLLVLPLLRRQAPARSCLAASAAAAASATGRPAGGHNGCGCLRAPRSMQRPFMAIYKLHGIF